MIAPRLSEVEERRLVDEYRQTRDEKLEARLLRSELGFVRMLTRQYRPFGIEYEDLFQEGVLGLLQAIRRFDPSRGVRLLTYAGHWVRAYEYQYIIANFRLVRLGTTESQRRIFFRVGALRARLTAAGVDVTPERLASLLRVDAAAVVETEARMGASEVSLSVRADDGERRRRRGELAAPAPPVDEWLGEQQIVALARAERDRFRALLTPRKRTLFDARWLEEVPTPRRVIGERIGMSRERVRQIEEKLLGELRERLRRRLTA